MDRQAWRICIEEAKAGYQAVAPYKKSKTKKRLQRKARYLLPPEQRLALPSIVRYYGIVSQIIFFHISRVLNTSWSRCFQYETAVTTRITILVATTTTTKTKQIT